MVAFFAKYPDGLLVVDGSELARVLDDSSDDISDAVRIMIDFIVAGAHEGS